MAQIWVCWSLQLVVVVVEGRPPDRGDGPYIPDESLEENL
jgi:hypothetical protein